MQQNRLTASVRHKQAMGIIDLNGTVEGASESELDSAYERASEGASTLVIGFDEVDYINSTGIALLVMLLARARRDGIPVRAWGLSDHYREIFELTRLAELLEVHADEASACREG